MKLKDPRPSEMADKTLHSDVLKGGSGSIEMSSVGVWFLFEKHL